MKSAPAIDISNTNCQEHNGKGDSTGSLDRRLSQGHRYHAIATDDAHFEPKRPEHGRNGVMVRTRHLTPASLLAALHAGYFYSTQGEKCTRSTLIVVEDQGRCACLPFEKMFLEEGQHSCDWVV